MTFFSTKKKRANNKTTSKHIRRQQVGLFGEDIIRGTLYALNVYYVDRFTPQRRKIRKNLNNMPSICFVRFIENCTVLIVVSQSDRLHTHIQSHLHLRIRTLAFAFETVQLSGRARSHNSESFKESIISLSLSLPRCRDCRLCLCVHRSL